jgi:hypothetical protein
MPCLQSVGESCQGLMAREELQIEARRFTSPIALAKEVLHLLDDTDCKVIVLVDEKGLARIALELEGRVTMGRLQIVKLAEEEPAC